MALPPPSHPSWARIKSTAWPHPSVVHIVPVPHLGELWKYYYVGGLHSIKRPITSSAAFHQAPRRTFSVFKFSMSVLA